MYSFQRRAQKEIEEGKKENLFISKESQAGIRRILNVNCSQSSTPSMESYAVPSTSSMEPGKQTEETPGLKQTQVTKQCQYTSTLQSEIEKHHTLRAAFEKILSHKSRS